MSKVTVIVVGESGESSVATHLVAALRGVGVEVTVEDLGDGGRTPEEARRALETLAADRNLEVTVVARGRRPGARGWTTNP